MICHDLRGKKKQLVKKYKDKRGKARVTGLRALAGSASYPIGFGYAMAPCLAITGLPVPVHVLMGLIAICCILRLVASSLEEHKPHAARSVPDDSSSEDGALDDVLVAPNRCKWRRHVFH